MLFQNNRRHPINADFENNDDREGIAALTQRTQNARFEVKEVRFVATDVVMLIMWYFHLETHSETSIPQAESEGTILSH